MLRQKTDKIVFLLLLIGVEDGETCNKHRDDPQVARYIHTTHAVPAFFRSPSK